MFMHSALCENSISILCADAEPKYNQDLLFLEESITEELRNSFKNCFCVQIVCTKRIGIGKHLNNNESVIL